MNTTAPLPRAWSSSAFKAGRWPMMLLVLGGCLGLPARASPQDSVYPPLRFGVSSRTMVDLNHADVVAAMKVWIHTVTEDRGIHVEPEPRVFDTLEAFMAAVKAGDIDIISAPTDEFIELERIMPLKDAFTTLHAGRLALEKVLLVHRDSPYQTLADLGGTRLMLHTHPSAGLATHWLDIELARAGLPPRSAFFRDITPATRLNRAILPVFFRQADAAIVTREGFAVAGELNPQLLRQLRILAESPPLIPGLGAYRDTVPDPVADLFRDAATRLTETPAGRHILNLFQCDAIVFIQEADLAPTRAFLAEHARIRPEAPPVEEPP